MKACIRCKLEKPFSDFSKDSHKKDGLNPYCRPCDSEMARMRRLKNPEKHKEWGSKWRERNPERAKAVAKATRAKNHEKNRAYQKEWQLKNREKCAAYTARYRAKVGNAVVNEKARLYREANREMTREAALRWQKANPGKANAANAARYAAKLRATPRWADLDAIECFYEEAERLKASTGMAYEVDHIVPLRSKIVCGLHCEANLRVIPSFDNRSKGNRTWPDMP